MNVTRLHPDARPPRPPEDAGVAQWLEALATGSCTQEEFLRKVQSLEGNDPELPWEVLSLLDQYLRREKITQDVYASLKSRLQQSFMGFGGGKVPPAQTSHSPAAEPAPPEPTPSTTVKMLTSAAISTGPLRVGDLLRGRYQIMDVLRKGPSGALFEAIDRFKVEVPDVNHRVAVEVFDEAARRDPGLLQRICRIQSLSHPGIERIYEVDEDRGALVLVKESLHGVSLQQLLEQGAVRRVTRSAAQMIIQNVASALAYAHSHHVFHGDVRAENVFVTDIGEVRLRGFEISAGDVPANPKGDRLAFSWFVYGLFSGLRKSGGELPDSRTAHTRRPRGVTSEQWRVLRDTMTGREGRHNVLSAFAGGNNPIGPVLLQHKAPRRERLGFSGWAASAVVAAILIVAGYFVITRGVLTLPQITAPPAVAKVPAARAGAPGVAEVTAPAAAVEGAAAATSPVEVPPAPKYSRALIDLPSESKSVPGDQPVARIWVRRREGLNGEVSFIWWTESGSAKVDEDFREITPRTATIAAGANGVELLVPLLENPSRDRPRTFYVKIDEPGGRARLGERTLMQVVIEPPVSEEAP